MDIEIPLMTAEAKCQKFASHFPISPFPFLISHFLVPTFRVTRSSTSSGLHGVTWSRAQPARASREQTSTLQYDYVTYVHVRTYKGM